MLNGVGDIGLMWKQQGQLKKTTFGEARANSPVRISLIKWEMREGGGQG